MATGTLHDHWHSPTDRIGATARAAFKRACRRVDIPCDVPDVRDNPKALCSLVLARPDVAADAFFRLCEASAKAWEHGNNSGNNDILARSEADSQRLGDAAEVLASLFGYRCDWPGLYPVLEKPGNHEYGTADVKAVTRAFSS